METTDELMGTWALVHPELPYDELNRQGEAGILTYTNIEADEFFVNFGKENGLYSADSVMVARPHQQIYADVMEKIKDLQKEQIKDLLRITMLLENGQPKDVKTVLEMAAKDKVVRTLALETLEEKFARKQQVAPEQAGEMIMGRGR